MSGAGEARPEGRVGPRLRAADDMMFRNPSTMPEAADG